MLITFFQRKVTKVFLLIKYPSRFEHSLAGNEMESSTGEEVASLMIETEVTVPVNEEHVVAAVDNDDNPIALNESVPHRDLAEGASIDTGDTADTSASGQEVGENEPAAKRHKLDVVVPEDYVDEEEDFPADWKGEVEEEEEDEDEGFSITLGDTRPR
ncbi:hypothetical protein RvY_13231-3 [Ramazzottius varieornatus]|nr:hypothetical protein RvY_13231-3 [Ramazzottius varieornatus]